MTPMRIFSAVAGIALLVLAIIFYNFVWYTVDATEMAVFQRPYTGTLELHASPGTKWRMLSSVTEYRKRDIYTFEGFKDLNNPGQAIRVQFNDGGFAYVVGNISWLMPQDEKCALSLHTEFRNQDVVESQLIRNSVQRAMTLTSPLMSSTESYAARRNEFLQMFSDQLENGIYEMNSRDVRAPDPITGEMKTVKIVEIVKDPKTGLPKRSEESPLKKFCIETLPPTVTAMHYDAEVIAQINKQRDNFMQIQTSQAEAKKAEQAAVTAAKNGEAAAMAAKWEQETIKAKAVTLSEQNAQTAKIDADRQATVTIINAKRDLEAQTLGAQTAEQYKREQTLRGEGDAARRQLVMQADGALERKLETYIKSQELWAGAFKDFKGSIVPQFAMGGTGTQSNSATDFMTMMTAKAAKDLALDLNVQATAPAPRASK